MKIIERRRFGYPGFWGGSGWCDVDGYRAGEELLVILRDQDDHHSTSVMNAFETVAFEVSRRLLEPANQQHLPVRWVHWSRTDGIASAVHFLDPQNFALPQWSYLSPLSPEAFGGTLAEFGAPDELGRWVSERSIGFAALGEGV